jgi:hypothetical protein
MRIRTTLGVICLLLILAVVNSFSADRTQFLFPNETPFCVGDTLNDPVCKQLIPIPGDAETSDRIEFPFLEKGISLEVGLSAVGDLVTIPWVNWRSTKASCDVQLYHTPNRNSKMQGYFRLSPLSIWELPSHRLGEKTLPIATLETDPRYLSWLFRLPNEPRDIAFRTMTNSGTFD